jgi:hypothetical protein
MCYMRNSAGGDRVLALDSARGGIVPNIEDADYFREKAAQCRRLAATINQNDPAAAALLALAVEFEAKAVAMTAEDASAKQVDLLAPEPDKEP